MEHRFMDRKLVCTVLAILWAMVIFSFSAKNSEVSTEDSRNVGKLICRILVPEFDNISEEEQYQMAGKIDYPVRKLAHAAEYTVLGILLAGAVYGAGRKRIYNIYAPCITGMFYAVTDELHQHFVPGRSCKLFDIVIDSLGVLSGVLILLFIVMIHRKLRARRR